MAINRTIIVTVPSEAYIEKNTYVFVKDKNVYDPEKRYNRVKHTIIGRSIGNGQMYPNHNFRIRYPALFEAAAGEQLPKQTKKLGLYAAVLSLAERTGLYDALIESYGLENANRIMDLAMYYMLRRSWDTAHYQVVMAEQMLFLGSIWNQTNHAKFFKEELTEERTDLFLRRWAGVCTGRAGMDAWISIRSHTCSDTPAAEVSMDATTVLTNSASGGSIAAPLRHAPADSILYAIDSRSGVPLTFSLSTGGQMFLKSVMEMIGWLKAYGIKINGVILDHEYASHDVFTLLEQAEIPYVAMMEDNTRGHRTMVNQYGDKIRMQYEYMLYQYDGKTFRSEANVLYGTQSPDRIRLFTNHEYEAYTSIIYDSTDAGARQEAWFKQVANNVRNLQQTVDEHKEADSKKKSAGIPQDLQDIPEDYAECIRIVKENGETIIKVNQKLVQDIGNRKSFYTIASSHPITAEEAAGIYSLKSYTEEQFDLTTDVAAYSGATSEASRQSAEHKANITVTFIAAIIRNELFKACTESDLSPKTCIEELNGISMYLNGNKTYIVNHKETASQLELMKACGIQPEDLDMIAATENMRLEGIEPDPHHRYPRHTDGTVKPPKRPGRPRGSGKRHE
jgi:hypothetical protein